MKPCNHANGFTERLQALVKGSPIFDSEVAQQEFILGGCTYTDIYAMAAGIGAAVSPHETCVCLCAEDKGVIMAALLASLSHGFTLVLPYAYSGQALQEVFTRLNRDQTRVSTAIVDRPRYLPPGVISLEPQPAANVALPQWTCLGPDAPFCHFFTGGSTGKPKIWSKTPRNLLAEAFHLAQKYQFSAHDRIVSCAPPFHLYGFTFAVLLPFVSLAKVAADIYTYPQEIRTALADYRATVFIGAPMHYRILKGGPIPSDDLRLAFASTGKLDDRDGRYFQEQTGANLVEIYGSTETGVVAARCRAKGQDLFSPLDIVTCKVRGQKLYVRSPFTPPDIETDADGYFGMGDRVRVDYKTGSMTGFELLGRVDGIVKVGGKRVDMEEICQKIKKTPKVEDAVVIARTTPKGRGNTISALVQGDIKADALRRSLSATLEPYAMPRQIKIVTAIPMAPTGKYDRPAIEALLARSNRI